MQSDFEIYNGDCVDMMQSLEPESMDFSVFSPPFSSVYSYTEKVEDLGNSSDYDDEFKMHYAFFAQSLYPLIKQGRLVAVHIKDVPRTKAMYGESYTLDLSGDLIRLMNSVGFKFLVRVGIRKNPQAESIVNHVPNLTMSNLDRDQTRLYPVQLDWLLLFRKPGKNHVPVKRNITNDRWIELAEGFWTHIRINNTLNTLAAKSENDEKHICPLQLDLIRDLVLLYTNKGETVFSPFAGIGSEGYQSLMLYRKFVGIELKEEYYNVAKSNLKRAISNRGQLEMELNNE